MGSDVDSRGERRQLTVMFCDLVDSAALAERLDPEDLREVLGSYQDACARVIDRFEGQVAQYLGDGLLVYFAYPEAHEDDAERAVRAGLEVVAALAEDNQRLERERGLRLRVRVGIHTGPVVVGEVGEAPGGKPLALGHTLNVAARLQGVAAEDSVVMSADTLRLVRGLFVTQELGSFHLKGIAHPIEAHRAVRPSGVRSRFDVAVATGLTPLVGREPELAMLLERWERARRGDGQVVLLGGEPGIGKSRLVRAFRERLADARHSWLECRGSPHHANSALHPVLELLHQGLRFTQEGALDEQIAWLEGAADLARLDRAEAVPLLARLLSLELPERYRPLPQNPEAQRRRTLEALGAWLFALAELQPMVLVAEDLHWTDPSSLELLGMLIERAPTAPLLLLATFRPGFEPRWSADPHLTRWVAEPLSRPETAAMVKAVAGDAVLPPGTVERVVRKTDGVPLFVEELTKSVLESGPGGDPAIPATLQDSLMARLDRLGSVKELAQLSSVLGREFSHALLSAVWTGDAPSLERGIDQLRTAELVFQRGEPPDASYIFKHVLIQETAYRSLLKETRRAWHVRVAEVLARRFPERVAREPEEIARHCESGGLIEQAISHTQRAGELAAARSAHAEAIGHLTRALELLHGLPACPERAEQELVIQLGIGASTGASKGWGTREAEHAYDRARQLCERIGETPQLFPVIRGLTAYYTSHAELDTALSLGTRLLHLAKRGSEPSELLIAHHHMGVTHFLRGDPAVACEHFESALGHYDPSQHRSLASAYQADPGVFVRNWMSWALWVLGYPERALAASSDAVEIARQDDHPFSLGYALLWSGVLHLWRREREVTRELAEEAIGIGREQEFPFVVAGGRLLRSVVRVVPEAEFSEIEAALAEFRQALLAFGATGSSGAGRPHTLGELGAALAAVGRGEAARSVLDAGLAFSEETSQKYWDSELLRLRGELAWREPAMRSGALRDLRLALDVARKQKARMLELRAAVSLSRMLQEEDGGDRGLGLLAGIYDSFTEGLEGPDLAEARALLDRSTASVPDDRPRASRSRAV